MTRLPSPRSVRVERRRRRRSWTKWRARRCAPDSWGCVSRLLRRGTLRPGRPRRATDDPRPADAIVVLGAAQYDGRPSPQLAARLDHVVELWHDGVRRWSWSRAASSPATASPKPRRRPTTSSTAACRSRPSCGGRRPHTYESLDGVADRCSPPGSTRSCSSTDPYHSLRSRLIAEAVGLDAARLTDPDQRRHRRTSFRRELEEAGGVAVGRIIGFDRLSDLTD